MIIVTASYKDKKYKYKYEGNIDIAINDVFLSIHWSNYHPQVDSDEWITYCSNGWDLFHLADVVSIEGHVKETK
jgi:hypothetical protein